MGAQTDKKSFGRDVGKLVSGTVVAQAVAICLTPIITRIFSPEIYGVASVFTSIVSIIVVVACMRYELAILLPKDDRDAGAVFLLCLIILVCVSLACVPVMLLFGDVIAGLLGNAEVAKYLWLVPIAVFIDGLYVAVRYWNTRRKRFGAQAVTQALQSVGANGLRLGFGTMGWVVPGALIGGQVIGQGIGTLVLVTQVVRNDLGLITGSFSFGNIKRQMVRYKKFPMIDTWSGFLNTASSTLPVFLLSGFFSSTVVGLYSLGHQILTLPMGFIGSSIGQVFFQRAAAAKHEGTLATLVENVVSILISISIVPFLIMMVVGGTLFSVVFGSEWHDAGVFAQILAIWILIVFFTSPISTLISVLEIQGFGLKMNLFIFVTRLVTLSVGGIVVNIYIALILFALSGVVFNGYYNYYVVHKAGGKFINIFRNVKSNLAIGVLLSLTLLLISIIFESEIIAFVVACVMVISYEVCLFAKNKNIREII